jgi:hypothetical protein
MDESATPPPGKLCTGPCGQVKTLSAFRRDGSRPDGRESRCAECKAAACLIRDAANKAAVFDHYGRACACCGATDDPTIDHIHGGGRVHRRQVGRPYSNGFYAWLIRERFPDDFQTLCLPCNISKGTGTACRIDHNAPPGWKRCYGPCKTTKPLNAFSPNAKGVDGRDSRCLDCRSAANRARYAAGLTQDSALLAAAPSG